MLTFFGNVIATLLTAYLSLVGGLADGISYAFISPADEAAVLKNFNEPQPAEALSSLPSQYEYGGRIPKILIENASYQKAAVIESGIEPATTTPTTSDFAAVVNIYCTYTTSEYQRTIAGSGFFVNDNGVILTNAHVAQFLLLEDIGGAGKTECIVRTGSVATPSYRVGLLYISPAWIQENATTISQAIPRGTGERDYALLYVTASIDDSAVSASFPYLEVSTDLLTTNFRGEPVTIAGYPAADLAVRGPDSVLTRETATSTLVDLFTFGSEYADIVFLGGTSIGEHGISGGPVVSENNKAIALISTRSNDKELGEGSLNAITLSYIHRTMLEETGYGFTENIGGNLPFRSEIFKTTIVPFLQQMLTSEL